MRVDGIGDATDLLRLAYRADYLGLPAVDRIAALRELEATARAAVTTAIDDARHESASWADIAAALGTSRQAAWERYAAASRSTVS